MLHTPVFEPTAQQSTNSRTLSVLAVHGTFPFAQGRRWNNDHGMIHSHIACHNMHIIFMVGVPCASSYVR